MMTNTCNKLSRSLASRQIGLTGSLTVSSITAACSVRRVLDETIPKADCLRLDKSDLKLLTSVHTDKNFAEY